MYAQRAIAANKTNVALALIRAGAAQPLVECSFVAAEHGNVPVIRELMQHGADVNAKNRGGWSLLMKCSYSPETTRLLLDMGADPNYVLHSAHGQEFEGATALSRALEDGKLATAELLLQRGADPNPRSNARMHWTPLIAMSGVGYVEAVKLLLKQKADLTARDASNRTALMYAQVGAARARSVQQRKACTQIVMLLKAAGEKQ